MASRSTSSAPSSASQPTTVSDAESPSCDYTTDCEVSVRFFIMLFLTVAQCDQHFKFLTLACLRGWTDGYKIMHVNC